MLPPLLLYAAQSADSVFSTDVSVVLLLSEPSSFQVCWAPDDIQ